MAHGDVYDGTVILLLHGHGSAYSALLSRMAVHPSVGSINLFLHQPLKFRESTSRSFELLLRVRDHT